MAVGFTSKNSSVSHAEDARNGLPFQSMPCISLLDCRAGTQYNAERKSIGQFSQMVKCTILSVQFIKW